MATTSAIEWTEQTWNPVTGCDRVSPGCAHCYALELAPRLKAMGQPKYQRDGDPRTSGPGFGLTLHPDTLEEPLRRRKPTVYFVNSMSDLFHEQVPDEYIAAVFGLMAAAPQHTFQVLTKRPERMEAWFAWHAAQVKVRDLRSETWRICEKEALEHVPELPAAGANAPWPLTNVWLGTSIENRRFVHRADALRETPAAVRFISAEPLLGPLEELDLTDIDWLIAGGESGTRARLVRPEWVRDLRDRCDSAGVAFFFKQWGGRTPKAGGRELDGRSWDEMPVLREPSGTRRVGGVEQLALS